MGEHVENADLQYASLVVLTAREMAQKRGSVLREVAVKIVRLVGVIGVCKWIGVGPLSQPSIQQEERSKQCQSAAI
jgi:hypothetical protein